MRFLVVLVFLHLSSLSFAAKKCNDAFQTQSPTSSLIASLLEPLRIDYLLKQVDYRHLHYPKSVDPSLDKVVYTIDDRALLADKTFPIDTLKPNERIIETDYGYAKMDVHTLRGWTLLADIIKKPEAATKYLEKTANTQGYFPPDITRESAEWLRWSVFAKIMADNKTEKEMSKKTFPKNILEFSIEFNTVNREIFRRLVRQKELFIFPFGTDARGRTNQIHGDEAQKVLAILARYQLISNLYVKRPDNQYRLLSEFLDRDNLMLVSRFPELLPAYLVFEGGHISFPHGDVKIGYDDSFSLGTAKFPEHKVNEDVSYNLKFFASADGDGDGLWGGPVRHINALFLLEFKNKSEDTDPIYKNISKKNFEEIYEAKQQKAQSFLNRKGQEFKEITGYPVKTKVKQFVDSPFDMREFEVHFTPDLEPHIKAAFLVFVGLD